MLKEQYKNITEFIEAWHIADRKVSVDTDWTPRFTQAGYYKIILTDHSNWNKVHDWCEEELGREHYSWNGANFWFETEEDAFRFALRWGGA